MKTKRLETLFLDTVFRDTEHGPIPEHAFYHVNTKSLDAFFVYTPPYATPSTGQALYDDKIKSPEAPVLDTVIGNPES